MPLISKSAGKGAVALATIARQILAQQPVAAKPIAQVTYAPPVNGGQAAEFYRPPVAAAPPRTLDRNSSAFYGQGQAAPRPIVRNAPPVDGGQASEFYQPPARHTPAGYQTIRGEERRPDPRAEAIRLESSPDYATAMMNLGGFTGDLEIDAARHAQALREARKVMPRPTAAPIIPRRAPILTPQEQKIEQGLGLPSLPRAAAAPESPYPQPPAVYAPNYFPEGPGLRDAASLQPQKTEDERLRQLDDEISELRKIMQDGGGSRASSQRLAQLVAERNQIDAEAATREGGGSTFMGALGDIWDYHPPGKDTLNDLSSALGNALKEQLGALIERYPSVGRALMKLDVSRQHMAADTGTDLYQYLTDQGGQNIFGMGPSELELLNPYVAAAAVAIEMNPELKDDVIDLYENGFTSDDGQEFTEGRAVWEGLYARYGDDLSLPLKILYRLATDIPTDPLSIAPGITKVGRVMKVVGRGAATLPDASRATSFLGKVTEGVGTVVEESGRALDTLGVEIPYRGIRYGGRRLGLGRPRSMSYSPRQLEHNARLDLEEGADALARGRAAAGSDDGGTLVVGRPDQPALRPIPDQPPHPLDPPRTPKQGAAAVASTPTSTITSDGALKNTDLIRTADDMPTKPVAQRSTGELVDIPDTVKLAETPRLATAIARASDTAAARISKLNNPLLPSEHLASPVAGRGTLFDDAVNIAMAQPAWTGHAEAFYNAAEPAVARQLMEDPWYRSWRWNDYEDIHITAPMSAQTEAGLRASFPRSKSPLTARNMLVKESAEFVAILEAEAYHVAPFMRHFDIPLDPAVRTARVMAGGGKQSWVAERFQYLAERLVKTTDEVEAEAIWEILAKSDGARVVIPPEGGRPYITGVPLFLKDDIMRRLGEARGAFQDAFRATDDDIASVVDDALLPSKRGQPDVALQFEQGAYGKAPQSVAKTIREQQQQVLTDSRKVLIEDAKDAGINVTEVQAAVKEELGKPIADLTLDEINVVRSALRDELEQIPVYIERLAPPEIAALPTPSDAIKLQWRANREGGQSFGNQSWFWQGPNGQTIHRNMQAIDGTVTTIVVDTPLAEHVQKRLATGWSTPVDDFASPAARDWGSKADSALPPTGYQQQLDALYTKYGLTKADDVPNAMLDEMDAWLRANSPAQALPSPAAAARPEPTATPQSIDMRLASRGSEEAGHGSKVSGPVTARTLRDGIDGRNVMEASNPVTGRRIERTIFTGKTGERVDAYRLYQDRKYVATGKAERAANFLNQPAAREDIDDFVSRFGTPLGIVDPKAQAVSEQLARPGNFLRKAWDNRVDAADISMADDIHNAELFQYNQSGGMSNRITKDLDTEIAWLPPGAKPVVDMQGKPLRYRVVEAIDWVENNKEELLARAKAEGKSADEINQILDASERQMQRIANMMRGLPVDEVAKKSKAARSARAALHVHDSAMTYNREMRLFNPITGTSGMVGDILGNSVAQIVNGNLIEGITSLNPLAVRKAANKWTSVGTDVHRAAQTMASPFHAETGMVIPLDLTAGFTPGEIPTSGMPRINQMVSDRNAVIRGASRFLTVPTIKAGRIATDIVNRVSAYDSAFRANVRDEALPAFTKRLRETAGDEADHWISLIHARARAKAGNKWHGMFSPQDVELALKGVTKQNNDMARAWQSALGNAQDAAKKRTHDIFFTYKNTNADEVLRRVFTFHYWQSRAYVMHTRAALRNPVLLNTYYKLWEYVKEQAEEQNLPSFIKDMLTFYDGPNGLYGLFNPIGILLPTTIMDMASAEGEGWKVLLNQLTPFIGGALGVTGAIDTPTNILPTRASERWLLNFLNYMESKGHTPGNIPILSDIIADGTMYLNGSFTEQATNYILNKANERFRDLVPIAGDYQPFDRGANEMDQLRSYAIMVMEEQYGPSANWDNVPGAWDAYAEAETAMMSGADNAIANEAEIRWAREGIYQNATFWIPGGTNFRSQWRDAQMRLAGEAYDTTPSQRTTAQQSAIRNRELAKTANTAWEISSQRYYDIGTPQQQEVWDTYYDIINNPTQFRDRDLLVWNPQTNSWESMDTSVLLLMKDEDTRQRFADQWLRQYPGAAEAITAIRSERDTFKEANPEFADFTVYQRGVYKQKDEPGGIRKWREGTAETNPNFERAMDEKRRQLKGQGYTESGYSGVLLEAALDDWAAGQDAFMAATGMRENLNSPEPLSLYDESSDPLANPHMAFMQPGEETGGGGTGSDFTDNADKPRFQDKEFPEFAEVNDQRAFANLAAETIYGDQWDYDRIANDPLADNGWAAKKHPNTNYYPNGSNPGESTKRDRYYEWRQWMQATSPGLTEQQLSIDAWIDWELGIWQQLWTQGQGGAATPALWQRYLFDDDEQRAKSA